jgi:hypothetical protein
MNKIFYHPSSLAVFALSLSVLLITGCQREIHDPGGNTNPPPPVTGSTITDNIMVTASVRGTVIDENNKPVMSATVTSGTNTTTTDRYGIFRFNNISFSKANGYVKVTKSGYFLGTRTFVTTTGRTHNVRIKLIPKTNSGNFTGSTGGSITINGGGKLVMPANAVTDAGGNAYTGTVKVAMTWIDPTSNDLPNIIPGDLRGVTTTNEERGLQTFGMLGVELTGSAGQVLKIATGQKADLTFPIPSSLQGNAPVTIDLWHFDEAAGRWKQDGTATKSGSNYIAQVSHFSFWNCDAPFPVVNLCMTIISSADNIPANNVQIRIKRPNGSYGYGRTDSVGNLCGKVPKDEALMLEILSQCNTVVYSQNIGPFSSDGSLGTITATFPATSTLTITGTVVNCSNTNVANGAAVIYTGNGNSYSVPALSGSFSLTLLRCDNASLNFTVLGIDYTTQQQGTPVGGTGTTGIVNVGNVQACGTSTAQFLELMVDGNPYTYTAPPDYMSSSDSSGSPGGDKITIIASKNTGNALVSYFTFNTTVFTGIQGLELGTRIYAGTLGTSEIVTSPNPTVTITTFGPPATGFIEGNFNWNMDFGGVTKNVIGNFRVRRN